MLLHQQLQQEVKVQGRVARSNQVQVGGDVVEGLLRECREVLVQRRPGIHTRHVAESKPTKVGEQLKCGPLQQKGRSLDAALLKKRGKHERGRYWNLSKCPDLEW